MPTHAATGLALLAALLAPAACVIIQSVPDDRGRRDATPSARIILEQRQVPAPAILPPK
jgi:hypothetical protein